MVYDDMKAFLWYGYIPKPDSLPVKVKRDDRHYNDLLSCPLPELVRRGVNTWRHVIHLCLAESEQNIVVPLSGGLDSRAILAELLEHVAAANIYTYTFGVPGTYDYEIGNLLAVALGTNHCAFDLNKYSYSLDNLADVARRVGCQTALFQHAPVGLIEQSIPKDANFWMGFMGDALSGAHLPREGRSSWEEAKSHFARSNRFSHSVDLTVPDFRPESCFPVTSPLDSTDLSFADQLDFGVRQHCYIKPLVLLKGYNYCTPFLHSDWVQFMLSVPRRYRQDQFLYKEILKTAYPKLFALPTKNNRGLPLDAPRWRVRTRKIGLLGRAVARRVLPNIGYSVNPGINYIDFDRGLRDRGDLKSIVYENIRDLKKRGIIDWIDVEAIWDRHQKEQGSHADALTLLASLEINLTACGAF